MNLRNSTGWCRIGQSSSFKPCAYHVCNLIIYSQHRIVVSPTNVFLDNVHISVHAVLLYGCRLSSRLTPFHAITSTFHDSLGMFIEIFFAQ